MLAPTDPSAENEDLKSGGDLEFNDLRAFFDGHREGPGIWKWEHYFEVYDRHLAKFRGKKPNVLEIGIYSGGSLLMWRDYFGATSTIYGVDIEPACKAYERLGAKIFIGDQSDRSFWSRFRQTVPKLDVVIDDGGHHPDQQITSLQELLPHMRPGGVYICEDVHGVEHRYSDFVHGLASYLNDSSNIAGNVNDPARRLATRTSAAQSMITGISTYPYITVVELRETLKQQFVAPKHGTTWEPFLE